MAPCNLLTMGLRSVGASDGFAPRAAPPVRATSAFPLTC